MKLTLSTQKQHGVSYFQTCSLPTHVVGSSIITRIVLHLSTLSFDESNSCIFELQCRMMNPICRSK